MLLTYINQEIMNIFWIQLDTLKYNNFFNEITNFSEQKIIFTPNPEILLNIKKDEEFKTLIQKADYLTPDGIGLYIAFQIIDAWEATWKSYIKLPYYFYNLFFKRKKLYEKYGERICGSDLTRDLVDFASDKQVKIAIIDLYNPTDANKVASQEIFSKKLQQKFPKLQFDYYIYNPEKKSEIIEQIENSDAKILFSTLWMKKQESSIVEIMEQAKNIKIGLWIGSSFDYFIGFQKRAPKLFRSLGLEWFYRIFTGPQKIKRLKRIYNAIFVFLFNVLHDKK